MHGHGTGANALCRLPFFRAAGLDASRVASLRRRAIDQGECLYDQGQPAVSAFLLLSGSLQVLRRCGGRGESRLLREVGDLEVTGELGLLTGQPHACAAVASSPSEVLVLPGTFYLEHFGPAARASLSSSIASLRAAPSLSNASEAVLATISLLAVWRRLQPGELLLVNGAASHPEAATSLSARREVALLTAGSAQLVVACEQAPHLSVARISAGYSLWHRDDSASTTIVAVAEEGDGLLAQIIPFDDLRALLPRACLEEMYCEARLANRCVERAMNRGDATAFRLGAAIFDRDADAAKMDTLDAMEGSLSLSLEESSTDESLAPEPDVAADVAAVAEEPARKMEPRIEAESATAAAGSQAEETEPAAVAPADHEVASAESRPNTETDLPRPEPPAMGSDLDWEPAGPSYEDEATHGEGVAGVHADQPDSGAQQQQYTGEQEGIADCSACSEHPYHPEQSEPSCVDTKDTAPAVHEDRNEDRALPNPQGRLETSASLGNLLSPGLSFIDLGQRYLRAPSSAYATMASERGSAPARPASRAGTSAQTNAEQSASRRSTCRPQSSATPARKPPHQPIRERRPMTAAPMSRPRAMERDKLADVFVLQISGLPPYAAQATLVDIFRTRGLAYRTAFLVYNVLGRPTGEAYVIATPRAARALPGRLRPACVGSRGAFAAPLVHIRSSSLATLQADAQKARVQGRWLDWPAPAASRHRRTGAARVLSRAGGEVGARGEHRSSGTTSAIARSSSLPQLGRVSLQAAALEAAPMTSSTGKAPARDPMPDGSFRRLSRSNSNPFFLRKRESHALIPSDSFARALANIV